MICEDCHEDKPDVKQHWLSVDSNFDNDVLYVVCNECWERVMDEI